MQKTISILIILAYCLSAQSQCSVWNHTENQPEALSEKKCLEVFLDYYGLDKYKELESEDSLYKAIGIAQLNNNDKDCFCSGYSFAVRDSAMKILALGDPGHVRQYVYHHYAKQGIRLSMTGDIVGLGQSAFNNGYNYYSEKSFGKQIINYDYKKEPPCSKSNYDIKLRLDTCINITLDSNKTVRVTKKNNIIFSDELAKCPIYIHYYSYINNEFLSGEITMNYTLADLDSIVTFDLNILDPASFVNANVEISLRNFREDDFCWTFFSDRISYYLR